MPLLLHLVTIVTGFVDAVSADAFGILGALGISMAFKLPSHGNSGSPK